MVIFLTIVSFESSAFETVDVTCYGQGRKFDLTIEPFEHKIEKEENGNDITYITSTKHIQVESDGWKHYKFVYYEAPAWTPGQPVYFLSYHAEAGKSCNLLRMGRISGEPLTNIDDLNEAPFFKSEFCCYEY
ncbi:MAG: hypothetical protein AB1540_09115 [Bdellovibrionota bacterium]